MYYYVCPRCGFKNLNGDTSGLCPVCGMDCGIYKEDMVGLGILLYGLISFFAVALSSKLPIFLYDFVQINGIIAFCLWIAACVIMFFRALNRKGILTDGFITPRTVNDVLKGRVKCVDFRKFKNVKGNIDRLFDDNIAISQNESGITLFRNHPTKPFYNIKYEDISDMIIFHKFELNMKCCMLSAFLSAFNPIIGGYGLVLSLLNFKKHLNIMANTDSDSFDVVLRGDDSDIKHIYNNYLTERKKRIINEYYN